MANTSTLVSVIMPVYNGERFIALAIDSVLAQSYQNWELIVVNDGSTDGTAGVVTSYSDRRIRCIYQENRGLAGARNTGTRAARGTFLAFLDADDEWLPSFLNQCIDTIGDSSDPVIVGVYTSHVYIDDMGQVLPQPGNGIVPPHELPNRLIAGNFFPPCVVVVRTDTVREVGLFDETLPGQGTEDKDLWFRITREHSLLGIAEPLARYRVYPDSMSTNAASMHTNRMAVLTKHFGPEDDEPQSWSPNKRLAYSSGYRGSAFEYMAQGESDEGWRLLLHGARISPKLLMENRTYYELACLEQPRGYRGQVNHLEIARRGNQLLHTLDSELLAYGEPLASLRKGARGAACLAFSQLAENGEDWQQARHFMWQALLAKPRLLLSRDGMRRSVKLAAGRHLSALLRSLSKDTRPNVAGVLL